ncbi:DUF397 domain-containing protein [Streptomyces pseudogriseolus]|uniref:DUF397 domain-containing protein n=1 Tax=Streptomyces TaxID=1883 RepID=UPI0004CC8FCE|nr:DUF397 domain-containing protein [Streptomyces sp. NRRL F-5527]
MENWRKSSYSGPGDGNECVEIATSLARTAVRDSKAPDRATLVFASETFAVFVEGLKRTASGS